MANNFIVDESVLDNAEDVNVKPVVPGQPTAAGAPPAPNQMGPYFSGSISPNLQHDATFVGTKYGTPKIASFPLIPFGASASPAVNSAIKSRTTAAIVPSASTVGMEFEGTWNSSQNYKVSDVVIFNKSAYVALLANSNVQPNGDSDPASWQLLSENFLFSPAVSSAGFYGAFDKQTSVGGTSATLSVGPVTPAAAGEIAILMGCTSSGGIATPSGWQVLDNSSGTGASIGAYVQIQPTANPLTYTQALGGSANWAALLALFSSSTASFTATITGAAVTSNIVTITCANTFVAGTKATCTGLVGLGALNSVTLTILTASPTQFTAAFVHADYGPSSDSGVVTDVGIIQSVASTPGNTGGPSSTFPNPVTPGSTVIAMLSGTNAGGFGSGYSDITSMAGDIAPASWSIINSVTTNKPHVNLAYVQKVTGGSTVQAIVQDSVIGARYVIIELSGSFSVYSPYDVVAFKSNNYVCLKETNQNPTGDPSSWGLLGMINPMTTLGDTIYEDGTGTPVRLAGNTTAAKNYLTQTGTGSASAATVWNPLATADLPPIWNTVSKSANYSAVAKDAVFVNSSSGNVTITLPLASSNIGFMISVKKISSDSNKVIIGRTSSDTIDGATTQTILSQYGSMTFISLSGAWYII